MRCIYEKTYWNGKGKYPAMKDKVENLIPDFGEVEDADDNPALEQFRKACNCYYDLYNNGLCNRDAEFEKIFGFDGTGELTKEVVRQTEMIMNRLLLSAAKEQNVGGIQ